MTPTKIDDLLVEPMARAIGSAWKMGPWDTMDAEYQETFRAYASAAFAAQRVTLKSAGLFIGPVSATEGMQGAMVDVFGENGTAGEMWEAGVAEWQRGDGT